MLNHLLRSPTVALALGGFCWESCSFHIKLKYGLFSKLCLNLWQARKDELWRQSPNLNEICNLDLKGSAAGPIYTNLFSLIDKRNDPTVFLGFVPVAVWSLEETLVKISVAEIIQHFSTGILQKMQMQGGLCCCLVPFLICISPSSK